MTTCVVFVTNNAYIDKFQATYQQLITVGGYKGDVCLVIGDDLVDTPFAAEMQKKVLVKHFPNFVFPPLIQETMKSLKRLPMWFEKIFQYHKFHLFDTFFKRWDRIFYIDSGITIRAPIQPILDSFVPNVVLAHSDAYPTYQWKLRNQFDQTTESELHKNYNLDGDYCQTTILYYDTSIIHSEMVDDLFTLTCKYPTSITNDQGIIALYLTHRKLFQQITLRNDETYFYDYLRRTTEKPYIMLKNTELVCPFP